MERQRLSRELHDGLGQWLAAARFRLESTDCARPEVTIQNINETKRLVDNIIDEIRRISNNLMPGVLQEIGLESALYAMARELSREDVLKVLLTIKTPLDSLATDYQLYVFRIIQEALNNVVKHSKASEVNVEIQQIDATISLNIKDNGVGFSVEEAKGVKGNGLINMRERTHLLGGEMIISSNPSSGTLLTFTLPLTHLS